MSRSLIPKIFLRYLEHLSLQKKINFIRRTPVDRISVYIPGTQYYWALDLSEVAFQWNGPNAYDGTLPSNVQALIPLWDEVWNFSWALENQKDNPNFPDSYRLEYNINPERLAELESVRTLCEAGSWDDAMLLYEDKKKAWIL
tara:strand:+ start:822 stop:1250 length:429 start_codon:yes stop_codon:yes gene_type:complete